MPIFIKTMSCRSITRFIHVVLLSLLAFSASAKTLTGRVIGISDGDTVTLLDTRHLQYKIRLAGIDAPEKAQAFGHRSKEHLSQLVFDKAVLVEGRKTDRYGRLVGKVMVNGKDANLDQVRAGMAWHYKQYQNEQSPADRKQYAQAENQARQQRVGLWADSAPVAPWDFRHGVTRDASGASEIRGGCPCGGAKVCVGPKGGQYCLMPNGGKRYR